MIDYGKIIYLDVQKTGSSSVARFLRTNLSLPQLNRRPHTPVAEHRPETFYFISVRNPMAQYISLFQYGLQGRGGMAKRFREAGKEAFYQPSTAAFEHWLDFMLSTDNTYFFGRRYKNTLPHMIGLQSYRFLTLSFVKPGPTLR